MSFPPGRRVALPWIPTLVLGALALLSSACQRPPTTTTAPGPSSGGDPTSSLPTCQGISGEPPCTDAAGPQPSQDAPAELVLTDVRLETIQADAGLITAMAIDPQGRLFYSVLTGAIFIQALGDVSVSGTSPPQVFLEGLAVARSGFEDGLLGLALSPDFEDDRHVYIYFSVPDEAGLPVEGRILRYTELDGRAVDETLIVGGLPARPDQLYHFGGGLAFGPDGKLYLVFGDTNRPAEAQNPDSLPGSVLRFNPDGGIPDDNPIPGSPVYAYGIRNGFGLAWHPETGMLFESENGESCDDELNLIEPGGNYSWGVFAYDACPYPDGHGIPPLVEWTPTIAPTALTFYHGDAFPELEGRLLLCGFNDKRLYAIGIDPESSQVSSVAVVRVEEERELCQSAIAIGLDGSIYTAVNSSLLRIGPSVRR